MENKDKMKNKEIKKCGIKECDTPYFNVCRTKGYEGYLCNRHRRQIRNWGKITRIKSIEKIQSCVFCGSNQNIRKYNDESYCRKHYDHMRLFGYCKDRTIFDRNDIIIKDNFAELVLYDLKQNIKGIAIIDIEDIDKIKEYKWNLGSHGYGICTILQKCIHNLIMGETDSGNTVDHINRNRLDNRKENLRIITHQENTINQRIGSKNTSGFLGVGWDKSNNKWQVLIKKGEIKKSKRFKEIEDAVKQRLLWELELFGKDLAPQRHLFKEYKILN